MRYYPETITLCRLGVVVIPNGEVDVGSSCYPEEDSSEKAQ